MNKNVHLNLLWENIYFQIVIGDSLVESYSNIHLNNVVNTELIYKLASYKLAHDIYIELRGIYPGLVFCGVEFNPLSGDHFPFEHKFNLDILSFSTIELDLVWDNVANSSRLVNQLHYIHEMVKLPIVARVSGSYVIDLSKRMNLTLHLNFATYISEIKSNGYCLKLVVILGNGESQELILSHLLLAQLFCHYKLNNNTAENNPDTCFLIKKVEKILRLLWQCPLRVSEWHFVLLNKNNYCVVQAQLGKIKGDVFYMSLTSLVQESIEDLAKSDEAPDLVFRLSNLNIPVTMGETYLTLDMINELEIGDVILYPEANVSLQLGQHVSVILKEKKDVNKLIVNGVVYHD